MARKLTYNEMEQTVNELEQDLLKYKKAKEDALTTKRELMTIFNAITDHIAIIDNQFRIRRVNNALAEKLECTQDKLTGEPCYKYICKADSPPSSCPHAQLLNDGKEHLAEICFEQLGMQLQVTSCPLFEEKGMIHGGVHVARDITKNKKIEKALRESEEKYRLLVQNANDAIFIAQNNQIKFPNPKTMSLTGYSENDFIEIPIEEFIHPEDRERVIGNYRQRIRGQKPDSTYAFRVITKAGKQLWVQISAVQVSWENRPATLNFLTDITSQKELEAQLVQSQKMEAIGTLAGGIAHDFNNILSAIIGYTEIAQSDVKKGSRLHANLQQVVNAGNRAKELVKQILTFSRQTNPELVPLQMKQIAKDALRLLRASLPTTIEIRQKLKSESTIIAEATQLHQVLMNLCTNAAHAMQETGGILEVSLEDVDLDYEFVSQHINQAVGPYIKLTVKDSGHGMPPPIQDRIFEPFFTTKDKGSGTGMGLSVVHGIVQSHGGAITFQSDEDKGSTFNVFIPVFETEKKLKAVTEKMMPSGNEHILLIDDEEFQVDLGKQMLERLGYKVTAKTDSIEALKLFREASDEFDLVITDMTMPKMTGEKLATEFINIRRNVPIILCTGYSDQINEEKAKKISIKEYIMKPILIKDLAKTVRKVLDE